ncbi:MarR family transcriptional regulator [Actinokineospora sp. NBRC 105648]|nr:MarR family transcriptional regulator [Actinokineospora sp. NBRC 105648]
MDQREARVWRAYRELHRELQNAQERQLSGDSGLSLADYALLVPLSEAADGVVRFRDLGTEVGWERSRLSHQVSRMVKRGLVVREDCPEDARGCMIRLTEAGRTAIVAAAPAHVETVRRYFFADVADAELDVLDAVFTRLLTRLRDPN